MPKDRVTLLGGFEAFITEDEHNGWLEFMQESEIHRKYLVAVLKVKQTEESGDFVRKVMARELQSAEKALYELAKQFFTDNPMTLI